MDQTTSISGEVAAQWSGATLSDFLGRMQHLSYRFKNSRGSAPFLTLVVFSKCSAVFLIHHFTAAECCTVPAEGQHVEGLQSELLTLLLVDSTLYRLHLGRSVSFFCTEMLRRCTTHTHTHTQHKWKRVTFIYERAEELCIKDAE